MGSICSNIEKDDAPGEKDGHGQRRDNNSLTRHTSKRLQKPHRRHNHHPASPIADTLTHHHQDMEAARKMIDAHDEIVDAKIAGDGKIIDGKVFKTESDPKRNIREPTILDVGSPLQEVSANDVKITGVKAYMNQRSEIESRESTLAFDFRCTVKATRKERTANKIIQELKIEDTEQVYEAAEPRFGWGGQKHKRFPGDHFLSNVDLIEKTKLFQIATDMPKGAHLHIHFNACLRPNVLLDIAKTKDRMFINSDLSLAPAGDGITKQAAENALHRCEIRFSIVGPAEEIHTGEEKNTGDIFSPDYTVGKIDRKIMKYSQFLSDFRRHHPDAGDPEEWLMSKLLFNEEEAHNHLQTVEGAWEKFNGRTRMMKGLFNYESAYRVYTRGLLEDFVRDNIQYAEIRPNFMQANQVWYDDGSGKMDNRRIMELIIKECEDFQKNSPNGKKFAGLKIIYCTPRSFSRTEVAIALDECLEFKKDWPTWIAGFDLVGEESKGKPLKFFIDELLEFRKDCEKANVDIPFLFHCGETIDMGTDTDGNLLDALLLKSKRIGHGFALARHPYIMEHMKKNGICLEVCPISNEELGLTPRVAGHAMYNLLANNVHCTLNSDNGTIFRSTLSHDFYQAMVGKADMTLYGWRQLIEWSLDHSCMPDEEKKAVKKQWQTRWDEFVDKLVADNGDVLERRKARLEKEENDKKREPKPEDLKAEKEEKRKAEREKRKAEKEKLEAEKAKRKAKDDSKGSTNASL